jgi:hypothetical protein
MTVKRYRELAMLCSIPMLTLIAVLLITHARERQTTVVASIGVYPSYYAGQRVALERLSSEIQLHPYAQQITIRRTTSWLSWNGEHTYEIVYDRRRHRLDEEHLATGNTASWANVTDGAIHSVARGSGLLRDLAKSGCEDTKL